MNKNAEQIIMHWTEGDFPDHVEIVVNGRRRIYVDREKNNQIWCDAMMAKKLAYGNGPYHG